MVSPLQMPVYELLYEPYSVAYQDKAWPVLVKQQDSSYGYADPTDFELRPLAWKTSTQLELG